MKINNRSRKQSHKLDGIGVGRIRTFPFLSIPFSTPSLMIQWKLCCWSWKQKWKNQPIAKSGIKHCHWCILLLLLATPTMQFSLDHKQRRHKKNQCSAPDSFGLIFTRSYCSTLLITTPTTTLSLVKTSLKCFQIGPGFQRHLYLKIQGHFYNIASCLRSPLHVLNMYNQHLLKGAVQRY